MVDVCKPATLRGFPVSVTDIGEQMHLCHPLLSFEGDPGLYLAHRLDWRSDPDALAIADPKEASTLGTLLPSTCSRSIASGEGVVAVGAGFVQATKVAKIELLDSEIRFAHVDVSSPECWIGVATPALYAALRTKLVEEARAAFDEALGDAALRRRCLSKRGDAALLLMRKSELGRRDDRAIRQLAGARQNGKFDLYRRLLIRFALELDTQEAVLDERVTRYIADIANVADRRRFSGFPWLHALRQLTRPVLAEEQLQRSGCVEHLSPVDAPQPHLPQQYQATLALDTLQKCLKERVGRHIAEVAVEKDPIALGLVQSSAFTLPILMRLGEDLANAPLEIVSKSPLPVEFVTACQEALPDRKLNVARDHVSLRHSRKHGSDASHTKYSHVHA